MPAASMPAIHADMSTANSRDLLPRARPGSAPSRLALRAAPLRFMHQLASQGDGQSGRECHRLKRLPFESAVPGWRPRFGKSGAVIRR